MSVLPKKVKERHIVQPSLRDLHHGPSTRVLRKLVIVVGEGERPARGDTMARLGNVWFFDVLFFFLSLFSLFFLLLLLVSFPSLHREGKSGRFVPCFGDRDMEIRPGAYEPLWH